MNQSTDARLGTYEAPQVTDHGSIADHTFGIGQGGISTLVRVDVDFK